MKPCFKPGAVVAQINKELQILPVSFIVAVAVFLKQDFIEREDE